MRREERVEGPATADAAAVDWATSRVAIWLRSILLSECASGCVCVDVCNGTSPC